MRRKDLNCLLQSYPDHRGSTGSTGRLSALEEPGGAAGWSNTSAVFSHDAELVLVALSEVGDAVSQLCDGPLGGNLQPAQALLLSPLQDVVFDFIASI